MLRDRYQPVRMQRIALVAPTSDLRAALVQVADAGLVELDRAFPDAAPGEATTRLGRVPERDAAPALARAAPDLDACEAAGRTDLLAGEAQLEDRAAQALVRGSVAACAGWTPSPTLPELTARLAASGGAIVCLRSPPGDPPTLLAPGGLRGSFAPLVRTYAALPYADIDPSAAAGIAYVAMFGMMFADAGHGLLLLLVALLLKHGRPRRLARLSAAWPFLAGAGLTSTAFGLGYGEFFGPTGVVPTLWLAPLDHPVGLMQVAVGVGAVLLGASFVLGSMNRQREGGWRVALYAASGLAGGTVFVGLGGLAGGWFLDSTPLLAVSAAIVAIGGGLSYAGLLSAAGGGAAGAVEAGVELFDLVVRLGSNVLSFARLAAFGLTHAAIGKIVWDGTTFLWNRGGLLTVAAVALFLGGNALSFGLEALVAAVQALRLAYYELFSRIFLTEGRPFQPWHVPITSEEAAPCPSG
jgi:V/A-type H+-transporting ATPase subunit I